MRRFWGYSGGALATVIGAYGAVEISSRIGAPITIVGLFGIVLLVAVGFLPADWLPSAALLAYLLLPRVILSLNDILSTVTPSLIILVIWYAKTANVPRGLEPRDRRSLVVPKLIVAALITWLVLSMIVHGFKLTSVAWCIDLIVFALVIIFVTSPQSAILKLQNTFLWASFAMAIYCAIEATLRSNFLFTPIYDALGIADVQHWTVYRADGSLGHPLYAGLFFSMGFAIAFGKRLQGAGNKYLFFAAANMAGVLLTVSRNSLGAIAVAAGVIIVPTLFRQSKTGPVTRVLLALVVLGGVLAITQVSTFQDRVDSGEAQGSTDARTFIVTLATTVANQYHWLGSGPATALTAALPSNPTGVIIENGYLQLLISLGLPGLVLFCLLMIGGAIRATRVSAYASLGCVAAYAFSIGFFNILESSRPSLLLLGLVFLMAWRDEGHQKTYSEPTVESSTPQGVKNTRFARTAR